MRLDQRYAVNEKFTIFVKILWNFVKQTIPWKGKIAKVWAWSGKNWGFFINSLFQSQSHFLLPSLYVRSKNCSFLFDFHFLGPSEAFRQKWIPSRCQLPIFRGLRWSRKGVCGDDLSPFCVQNQVPRKFFPS